MGKFDELNASLVEAEKFAKQVLEECEHEGCSDFTPCLECRLVLTATGHLRAAVYALQGREVAG
jgi:hypothetical protein